MLTKAIVAETVVAINNDDDLFVAGIFSFVFADYFAMLLTDSSKWRLHSLS
jgi:hypothetical protein